MALILNIETSSPKCSVCLALDGKVIGIKETGEEQNHASVLAVFIDELMKDAGVPFKDLSAVAISAGPGSYTGLRIGTSTAKGICYALNIPLIAIDSLENMAYGYGQSLGYPQDENGHTGHPRGVPLLCPIIDARRMEVYYALFSSKNEPLISSTNIILDTTFLAEYSSHTIHFFGSGAEKLKPLLPFAHKCVFSPFQLSASFMSGLSYKSYIEKKSANTAYFEPNYIKTFYFGDAKSAIR